MTSGLEEVVVPGVTSKGSRYYKAMYSYPNVLGKAIKETVNIGQLLVEINSFANPYPYVSKSINCFIAQFFRQTGNEALIEEYGLQSFTLNVLDKRQTLTEKLVSLIRFHCQIIIYTMWQPRYATSMTCIICCKTQSVINIYNRNNSRRTSIPYWLMTERHLINLKVGIQWK